ncbi:hypothetical protein [Sandaracinus amylolyticus]|uniref:hypothetical protein n=1 Tax=Sandaracinus amylolyticus TaxID=927083 RepID=UPI001F350CBD|nr:hypothetical protein [Sandaracinus amylolyticus]UJR85802.1 Hypothetical protein I5071_78820 [Sandaracinus amylolyticus]
MIARLVPLAWLLVIAGCVATPLPDPPSANPEAITIRESQPEQLTVTGTDGAIHPGEMRLRITNLTTAERGGRIEVAVTPSGAFDATLPGTLTDTLYLEQVEAMGGGTFIAALVSSGGTAVMSIEPGPDTDGDGSPDLVDCAPNDEMLASRECAPGAPCDGPEDCGGGEVCVGGVCRAGGCAAADICGNEIDDDCNGIVDDCL